MRSILFRADTNIKSGTGDLLSLIYLSEYFSGWDKYFITKDTPVARQIMKRHKINRVTFIPANNDINKEISAINKFVSENKIDVFFLEITNGRVAPFAKVRAPFKACIDFFGKVANNFDLVINWDVNSVSLYNLDNYPDTLFLLGPKYAALSRNIVKKANLLRKAGIKNKKLNNILIFFGGFDEFNFTLKVVKFLENIGISLDVRVVLGAGYFFKKELADFIKNSKSHSYRIYQNVIDMERYYHWADLVVCSGGLSLFEVVALRIPAIVIATYKHQIKRCVFFNKERAVKYLGFRKFEGWKFKKILLNGHFQFYKEKFLTYKISQIINERLNYKIQKQYS